MDSVYKCHKPILRCLSFILDSGLMLLQFTWN